MAAVALAGGGSVGRAQLPGGDSASAAFRPRQVLLPGGRVELPMVLIDGARATVEGRINGRGPYRIAVETGGPWVLFNRALADSLGLPGLPGLAAMHGSPRLVDSLRIGDALFGGLPVVAMPPLLPGVDGLLGLPAVATVLMTLDYPDRKLVFATGSLPAPNGRDVVPTVPMGPYVGVMVDVAGAPTRGLIDTQAGLFVSVTPETAERLPFVAPPVPVGQGRFANGVSVPTRVGRLAGDLTIGGVIIRRPLIRVMEPPRGFPRDMLLGAELLREFRVTIDQAGKRVRFERATGEIPSPPPFRGIGLALGAGPGGRPVVQWLAPDGVAAAAGIRSGEVVVEIASRPASEYLGGGALGRLVQGGRPIAIVLERDGRRATVSITPPIVVQ